jgi:hypothetical protein
MPEIFAFVSLAEWPDSLTMYREIFNSFLPERCRKRPVERERRPDFPEKLTAMLIPGPPGAADQALSSMLLRERGSDPHATGQGRLRRR